VLGDSAGGGLTVALLLRLRDQGLSLPAAAVLLSPFVNLTASAPSFETNAERDPLVSRALIQMMAGAYVQGGDLGDPFASPVFADLQGLPPMLIQVGNAEVLLDDARQLADNAKEAGVDVTFEPWEDMVHVWHFYPWLPEARQAAERISAFIGEHVAPTPDRSTRNEVAASDAD
jgi:epsilon-lactone hydrolase